MRARRLLVCALLCLSPVVTPAAASGQHGEASHAMQATEAAGHQHEVAGHGSEAVGHGGHAEPPPSILSGDLGNVVWTLLIFLTLLGLLGKLAWPQILGALKRREQFILESLGAAKREREEANKLLADYTAKVHTAREEATAIIEEGKRDAEAVRKRIHSEAKSEADAMIARARKDIEMARDDAVKSLYDQAVTLATSMASKIVRKELSPSDHRALLDESIAELEKV